MCNDEGSTLLVMVLATLCKSKVEGVVNNVDIKTTSTTRLIVVLKVVLIVGTCIPSIRNHLSEM